MKTVGQRFRLCAVLLAALAGALILSPREARAAPCPFPVVTSVSPSSGPAGTSVTITGSSFNPVPGACPATAVKFGGVNATSFTLNSDSSITAIAPPGSGTVAVTVKNARGTSPTSAPFTYTTGSANVRAVQLALTRTVAAISGDALTGAIDNAIADAFAESGGPVVIAGPNGLFLNFAAASQEQTAASYGALAYAGDAPAPVLPRHVPPEWAAWADIRGTGFDANSSDTHGFQINLTSGIGRRLTPDLLVGVFVGYENGSFGANSVTGHLGDNGGTIGGYGGWQFGPHWRLEGAAGWSDILYNASASGASGNFNGSRFLIAAGVTGSYPLAGFQFEPSAHIHSLFESENAWTDSTGTPQAARNFSESLMSSGGKLIYPWWLSDIDVAPYAGFYADYRFSSDNALPVAASVVGIQNGWSGRATGGVSATSRGGLTFGVGGDFGGIGAGYQLWSLNGRVVYPF